jgi:hypothetical protein
VREKAGMLHSKERELLYNREGMNGHGGLKADQQRPLAAAPKSNGFFYKRSPVQKHGVLHRDPTTILSFCSGYSSRF